MRHGLEDEAQLAQLGERKRERRLELGRAVAEAAESAARDREAAAEQRAKARVEVIVIADERARALPDIPLAESWIRD